MDLGIELRFREEKATQAAARLLLKAGGHMTHLLLLKLLYLADREGLRRYGRPVVGDQYFSMDHGPILSRVFDLVKDTKRGKASYWSQHIGCARGVYVVLVGDPGQGELSRADIELLDAAFETYGGIDQWMLVDLLHQILPEWRDPQGSSLPIPVEDILRALGKPEDQILAIQEQTREEEVFAELFRVR